MAQVTLIMLTSLAGPGLNVAARAPYVCDAAEAKRFIDKGFARKADADEVKRYKAEASERAKIKTAVSKAAQSRSKAATAKAEAGEE